MQATHRCEVLPEAGHQVSFRIDGREVLRWHEGRDYPRPYFFPVVGPSGTSLTRMGHPGAPNHDHHQSLWFAHNKVTGIDFWGNSSGAQIRQLQWLAYEDNHEHCRMAVELGWFDGHDPAPLLKQILICEIRPAEADRSGEFQIELQTEFLPVSDTLEFGQTNFGFLAVRVAKSISGYFGGGTLTSSEGATGEPAIFGKPARWMDYCGVTGHRKESSSQQPVVEGITYFDHPSNPGQPTGWHVREDGWMCASPGMNVPLTTTKAAPLSLRYELLVHRGAVDAARNERLLAEFAGRGPLAVQKSKKPHTAWEITRG